MERKKLIGEYYKEWQDSLLRNIQIGDKGIKGEQNKIPISERTEFKRWDELYDDEDAKNEVRKALKRRVTVLEGQQVKGRDCDMKEIVVCKQEKTNQSTYSDKDIELIKDVERKLQSERLEGHIETFIQDKHLFDAYGKDSSSDNSVQTSGYHLFSSFHQMMKTINHPLYQSIPTIHGNVNEQGYNHCNETNIFRSNPLGQVQNHHCFNETLQNAHENAGMTVDSFNQYSGVLQLKNLGNIGQLNVNVMPLSTDTVRSCMRWSSETNTIPQRNQLKENRKLFVDEQLVENVAKSEYTQDNTVVIPMDISSEEEDLETPFSRKRTWSDFYSDNLPLKKKLQTAAVYTDKISKQAVETKSTSLLKEKSKVKMKLETSSNAQEVNRKKKESSGKKWLPESLSFVPCQDFRQESPPETPAFQDDKVSIKIKKSKEAAEVKEKRLLKTSNMQANYRKVNGNFQNASCALEFGKLKNVYCSERNSPIFDKENISKEMEHFFERPEESSEPEDQTTVEGNPGRKIVIVQGRRFNGQNKSVLIDAHDLGLIDNKIGFNSKETNPNLLNNSVNVTQNCDTSIDWKTKFQCINAEKDIPVVLSATSLNESLDNKTKNVFECEQSTLCDTTKKLNSGRKIVIVPGSDYDSQNKDGLKEQESVLTIKDITTLRSDKTKVQSNLCDNSINATQNCDATIKWKTKFQCKAEKDLPEVLSSTSLSGSLNVKTKSISNCDTTQKLKPTKKHTTAEKDPESPDMLMGKSFKHVVKDLSSLETFGQIAPKFKSKNKIDLAKLKNSTKANMDLLRKLDSSEPKSKKCSKGQVFTEHLEIPEIAYKPSLNDEEIVTRKFFDIAKQSVKYSPTGCPVTGCLGPGNISLKDHAFREHLPDIFEDKVSDSIEKKVFKCRKRFNILRQIAGSIVKDSTSLDGLVRFFNQGKRLPSIDLSDSLEAIRECCIHHGWKIPTAYKTNPINSISVLMNWHVLLYCVRYMSMKQRIAFKNMCNTIEGKQNIQSYSEKNSNDVDARRIHKENIGHSTTDLEIKANILENIGATRTTMNTNSSVKGKTPELFDKRCVNQVFESDCIVLSSDEENSVVSDSNTNILRKAERSKKLDGVGRQQPMSLKLNGNNTDAERSSVECSFEKLCLSSRLVNKEKCSRSVSESRNQETNNQEISRTILHVEQIPVQSSNKELGNKCNDMKMSVIRNNSTPKDKNKCLEQILDKSNATSSFQNNDNSIFGLDRKEKSKEVACNLLDSLIIYVCPCGKMATDHDLVFDHLMDHGGIGSIDVVDVVKDKLAPPLVNQDREDFEMFETGDDDQVNESSDDEKMKKREDAEYIAELTALIEEGNDRGTISGINECGETLVKENADCHVKLTKSVVETSNSIKTIEAFREEETDCCVHAFEENISSKALTSKAHIKPVQPIHTTKNSYYKEVIGNADQKCDVKEVSKSCKNDDDLPTDKNSQFHTVNAKYRTEINPFHSLSKDGQIISFKPQSFNNCKTNQSLNKERNIIKSDKKSKDEIKQSNPSQERRFFSSITAMDTNKEDGYQSTQKHFANKIDPKTSIMWMDGNSCPVPDCIGAKEFFNNFTSFDNHWKFYHLPFQVFKRCSICGEQSKRKYNMKKHVKQKHQGIATLITKLLPNEFYIDPGSTERYVHDRAWLHK